MTDRSRSGGEIPHERCQDPVVIKGAGLPDCVNAEDQMMIHSRRWLRSGHSGARIQIGSKAVADAIAKAQVAPRQAISARPPRSPGARAALVGSEVKETRPNGIGSRRGPNLKCNGGVVA